MAERRGTEHACPCGERAPTPGWLGFEDDMGVDAPESHGADPRAQRPVRPRANAGDLNGRVWLDQQRVWIGASGRRRDYLVAERECCLDEAGDPSSRLGVADVRFDGAKRRRNSPRLPVLGVDERLDFDLVADGCPGPMAFEKSHG